ncbi:MAG: hypothetical protein HY270_01635 [Deltaproteobacteria bacterium]|nr:hypothetical protein [Deltaproteobacteria bacterium]
MPVRDTLKAALDLSADKAAADEARLWLERVEALFEWIALHPKLVEVRYEAARLLTDLRGSETTTLDPKRRV